MKHKALIGAGMLTCACVAFAAKDPIIMTVGQIEVPLSEFEYLYNKNVQQQMQAQPLDEYVELFKLYKMKVADAAAEGIDTTAKFRKEMSQYRDELAAPYLTDSVYMETLLREAYDRMGYETDVKHIMRMKKPTFEENSQTIQLLDSLRGVINKGGDFAALAGEFSEDRGSASNGGDMGFMQGGMLPYKFETVMLQTPKGQISEIVESPMAYHIILGTETRPTQGSIKASHILKTVPADATAEQEAAIKAQADSIYQVVKANPAKFEELARKLSDDPGSASRGGSLGTFSTGQMVKPFNDAAFALKDGEISEPVRTRFGYHVIYRQATMPQPSYDKMKERLVRRVTSSQDERSGMMRDNMRLKLAKKFNVRPNQRGLGALNQLAAKGIDSTFYTEAAKISDMPLYRTAKGNITVGDFLKTNRLPSPINPYPQQALELALDNYMYNQLMDWEKDRLDSEVPEYHNLLKEYKDGSMLYEVSLRKVWDKASQDTEGQQQYFANHRDEFKWTEPRVKGYLVKCVNDTVAKRVNDRMRELQDGDMLQSIRDEFGRDVQIDRMLVKAGDNALIDYLMQNPDGDQVPAPEKYPSCFLFNAVVLEQPSEFEDVKGMVTSAYQDQLEQEWIQELQAKYPVKVDKNVLKKVK